MTTVRVTANLPRVLLHYPRATSDDRPGPPSPVGESFTWSVANEKSDAQYTLQNLASDTGLPTLRAQRGQGGRGRGGSRR